MKKQLLVTIIFSLKLICFYGQTKEEIAAKNFELHFISLKNSYQVDLSKSYFNNYSELWERKAMPIELKMMLEYDTLKFYNLYIYHTNNSRDTLIRISTLDYTQYIKDLYLKFKRSIIDGEKHNKYNWKQDKEYSENLKLSVDQIYLPIIGYYQSAVIIIRSPPGRKEQEIKIIITYNNDLEPIEFNIIE